MVDTNVLKSKTDTFSRFPDIQKFFIHDGLWRLNHQKYKITEYQGNGEKVSVCFSFLINGVVTIMKQQDFT